MSPRRLLAACLLLAAGLAAPGLAPAQVCAVPGTLGAGSVAGIVNTYYPGAAPVSAGSTSIAVGAPTGAGTPIAAGDLLLVIQIQDASISTSNTAAYGGSGSGQGYTSLNSAGLYEYAVAAGPVGGGFVTLASPLVNSYSTGAANAVQGQRRFQVIRVPQYSSATVTGTVTAPPWDGNTGGIVAFDVAGQLNWNGQAIDVNGRGFRGGGGQCSIGAGGTWSNQDYRTSSTGLTLGIAALGTVPNNAKGEGVAGTPIIVFTPTTPGSNAAGTITNTGGVDGTSGGYPAGSFGRGAPGNAGGGGTDGNPPANDQNTGGGGGGNFGIGGKGGYGWTPGTPPGFDTGGFGGMSVPSGAARLFFGGGGGAGTTNNCTGNPNRGAASSGAAGGGMVFVRAGSVLGGGTINARGTDGNSTITNDASGGGGAGGSALVFVNNSGGATGVSINVQGGNGGSNTGGGSPHGPGGGGSGGFAITSGAASFGVAGGVNGTTATSATSTAEYGSSSSVGGFQITSLAASQIPGAGGTSACFPELTVVKTTTTPTVAAGSAATYRIVATNTAGKQPATAATITDPLPGNPNITYASTTSIAYTGGATRTAVADPAVGATTPAWGSFSIPGGGSVTITFVANVAAATPLATYQNPANVTYLDPTRTAAQTVTPGGTYTGGGTVGGSNYASASSTGEDVTVVTAPLVSKSFTPGAISVGGTAQLSVVVSNPGAAALANVGLVDNYPAGMVNGATPGATSSCGGTVTATPGAASFTLAGGAIAAAGSCTITVNVTVNSPGPYVNTIPAGALTNTQGITNAVAGTATLYNNVTIAKAFSPNAVAPNADATLTLTLANGNTIPMTLANPGFTDTFPAGLVATGGAVTASGCGAFAPATIGAGATSFTATAGTIAAGATCTVSFAVRSAATGIYANTSSGVTTTQAGTTGPASNTANLGVGLVNIAKQFAPATILSGGTSTVTLTLSNPTGVAQSGGDFTDTLVDMAVASNQAVGGTCTGVTPAALTAGQTALSFTGVNVPAGSCTITFTVTSATVGSQDNVTSGVATSTLPRGPASNTATLSVLAKPTIAKAFSPATIATGGVSTLTFTLTNPGPLPLTGVSFTDSYPAGLVNTTPRVLGGSCTGVATTAAAGGSTFNVTAGNLPASGSCTITVQVTAAAAGSYANTSSGVATNETGSAGAASNTATLFVASAPTITKSFGTSPIAQGGTSVATFTLTNGNAVALTNLAFGDALVNMAVANPALGGTCAGTTNAPPLVAGATALNLTVPSLAAGASCTVTVTLTSAVSGTHPNATTGVTSTETPAAGAPSNTANLVVLSPPALQKNFSPGSLQSGATTSSIVFTLTNPNAAALTSVTFSDPLVNMALAAGAGVSETCAGSVAPAGVSAGSTNFTLVLNTLNAAETCTITVGPVSSSTASPAGGHPNTTSTVTSTQTPAGGPGATGYLNVLVAPAIAKSFNPNTVVGATSPCPSAGCSTITFTLTNPNSVALTNVTFTDAFPANMRTVAAAQNFIGAGRGTCTGTIPSAQGAVNQTSLTFSATTLPPNSSCTIMADVQVTANGTYTNTTSGVTSNQTPVAGAAASDILARGVVSVTKSFSPDSIQVGGTSTLTFRITNSSGANRSGLAFTDNFPAGMTAVGGAVTLATVSGSACSALAPNSVGAGATAYNLTALTIPNNAVCTVTLAVQGTTAGVKSNTVSGTAPSQFASATDTATLTVHAAPTIAKAFAPATIAAGGTSTITFTLANPNAFAPLTGAAFTDTLANMSVAGAQTVGGTCAGTTPANLAGGATNLAFTGISLPAGGSCTVTVVVTSTVAGTHPNTASGATTTQTPAAGANSGAVNLTVGGIAITKAFAHASRPVGLATTLTVTLSSAQAVAWSGLAFTDTLPAGLVVANPANAATTCGAGSVSASPGGATVSLSGGTMAAGASPCTVSVDVVSAAAGSYTNATANFTGLSTGASAAGASATVVYFPAAAVTKGFAPASISAGGVTTLTFTLANPGGAQAVSGLGFTDTLPAGVSVASPPAAANTCGATFAPTAGASVLTLSGASLGAGPASCTAQVNVTAATLGSYTNNSANFSAPAGGLDAATANASFSVVGAALAKAFSPTSVGPGSPSTLTFTITNGPGNPAQAGLAFTDTLPVNLVVATPPAATNTCGGTFTPAAGAGSVSLAGGALGAGQGSCTLSVDVSSALPGNYANTTVNVSGAPAWLDTSGVNATLAVQQRPTAAKAFGAANVALGGATSLTLTFTNPNATPVTGLAFTDTFPVAPGAMTLANAITGNTCGGTLTDDLGAAIAAGAAGLRLAGGTIPGNGSCAITANVTAAIAGAYTNTIGAGTITTTNAGTVAAATSASVTFLAPPTIAKAFGGPIGAGQVTTLTFTIQNPNATTALTGVAFSDAFPASPGAMVVAAAPGASTAGCGSPVFAPTAGAASVSFSGGSVAAGGTCTATVNITAPSAGLYNNTSAAITSAGPIALANGTASASLVVGQPALTKAFAAAAINDGGTTSLVFTITNIPGNPAHGGIGFTDTLPTGLAFGSATPAVNYSAGCSGPATASYVAGTRALTVAGVAMAGGTASCTVAVAGLTNAAAQVNPGCPAAAFTNGAGAMSGVANVLNAVTDQCLVVNGIAPALTKAFSPSTIDEGGVSTLTFTLANTGTNPAQSGIGFTDTLPAGVLVAATPAVASSCPSGTGAVTAAGGSGTITVAGATMGAGQASCTISVNVTSAVSGVHANTDAGNISGQAGVTTAGVNANLTVLPLPALTKAFSPGSVGTGQNAVLTFTIANPAGSPARSGLAFTDTLPAGLVVGTPAGVANGCGGTPTITATPGGGVFSVGGTGVGAAAGPSSCTIALNVASAAAGAYVNGAAQMSAVAGMINGVTNQTLTVLERPGVAKAFGAASIVPGAATTLTITLTNANAVPITGVAFTDVFPASPGAMTLADAVVANTCGGALADSGGGGLGTGDAGIALSGGTIPAGASCAITVNVTAATPGTYTNTLAAGAVTSANAASNTAPASANLVVTASATIAKAFAPATIAADATSTITFTLANPNPGALTNLRFTDALSGMAISSATIGGTCAGTVSTPALVAGAAALDLTVPTLAGGASCTITLTVTSDIPGAHDNQTSGVSSVQAPTGAVSNIATLTVTAATPAIAKAFAPATINADGTSTITFTLANTNGIALTAAGFTDALSGMAVAAAGPAGGTCTGAAGNALTAGQAALTLSNLTIPANGSCTVAVVVTSDVPGAHDNTASGITSTQAPAGAGSNTATLTVNAVAPTIAKAFAPATIAAGATSTITFTLANTLGVPLTSGAFSDTLAGMSVSAAGPAGGTCAGAAGNVFGAGATALAFTGLTVPANGSCTVTVVVTSSIPGAHDNATTALTSAQAPASAVSNTATLTVTAVAPTIAKAFAPASIVADATSTITFTIANSLGVPLTSANFTDTLANMQVNANGFAGGTCAGAGGNFLTAGQTALSLTGLTIPASASCTVTVVVSSDLPGTHPNQASGVASTEAATGAPSNSASLTVTAAVPTIAKAFAPAAIVVNATSTITFTLANGNGIPLTGASFTDTLANMQVNANGFAGGTCAGASGNALTAGQTALSFTGLTVPANGSCTVAVVVLGNVIGTHPNQSSGLASAQAATGPASNVANLVVQPLPPTISKQFLPASILSGGVTTLRVTIGNPNPSPITVTSVTDTYPAGVTTAGTPATSTTCLPGGVVSFNAGSVTLTGGDIAANGSCTFQVDVTAATQGLYTNTIPAGALTTTGGFNAAAASANLSVDPVADLAITKNAPASVGSGQALAYTISVTNNGPDAADGAQFSDNVPGAVAGVGAVCGAATGGAACGAVNVAGNAVTSTITTLPAGASVTFTITGTATGLATISNTASVAAPAGVLDPAPGNNSASADTAVLAPDLTLVKSHAGNFTVGTNGTYTLVASNGAGSLSTTGVITVVDTLPAGLGFVSGTGTGWSCGAAGQTVTCTTAAAIAAGTSAPAITLTVSVAATAVPSVLNIATVSGGGEPAAANGNNTASDNTIVVAAAANAFAPDGAQSGAPGTALFYPHTFNAGLAGSVAFSTSAVATPAVPGWSQAIYRDADCNGTLDGAEGAAPLAGAIAVNPGDAVCIVVRDSIPGAAPYNAQNVITVSATFNGSQVLSRTDTTTVGGAGLTLAKTVRNVTQGGVAGTTGTARPDDVLEYTITYTNTGAGPVSAIVVTDATPAFTVYLSAACGGLPANLTACVVSAQPAVNGTGSVVWTLTGTLQPSASGSVSYQVRVSN